MYVQKLVLVSCKQCVEATSYEARSSVSWTWGRSQDFYIGDNSACLLSSGCEQVFSLSRPPPSRSLNGSVLLTRSTYQWSAAGNRMSCWLTTCANSIFCFNNTQPVQNHVDFRAPCIGKLGCRTGTWLPIAGARVNVYLLTHGLEGLPKKAPQDKRGQAVERSQQARGTTMNGVPDCDTQTSRVAKLN